MMPKTVQIRGLDDEVYEALRLHAANVTLLGSVGRPPLQRHLRFERVTFTDEG